MSSPLLTECPSLPPAARRLYTNRTLNLRSIRAVGCDMDYTLIHYNVDIWEARSFEHARERLCARGWPAEAFRYDPEFATRGLVLDLELGNIVKANRFGYVVRAFHGTQPLPFEAQREAYARTLVDLSDRRWVFMNTLFALSEANLFAQSVDLLDAGRLDDIELPTGLLNYEHLYRSVKVALDATHMEGELKDEICADPEKYVEIDDDLPLTLLDIKRADKKLLLITNSEWGYTRSMMSFAFDRLLPDGMTWRDLFEVVVVQARKPAFFSARQPVFEVTDDEAGLLRPWVGKLETGRAYLGGDASQIERMLGVQGEEILYIGDHLFADVRVSKDLNRWRTALVVRELEDELDALTAFEEKQRALDSMMDEKERLEHWFSVIRLEIQRQDNSYGEPLDLERSALVKKMTDLRKELVTLDGHIAPLAAEAAQLMNSNWGPLMRAGNDKSNFARQLERAAEIYTSRVSNLLAHTPFVYLRAPRGSLPHDADASW